jgi:hypothetical protein
MDFTSPLRASRVRYYSGTGHDFSTPKSKSESAPTCSRSPRPRGRSRSCSASEGGDPVAWAPAPRLSPPAKAGDPVITEMGDQNHSGFESHVPKVTAFAGIAAEGLSAEIIHPKLTIPLPGCAPRATQRYATSARWGTGRTEPAWLLSCHAVRIAARPTQCTGAQSMPDTPAAAGGWLRSSACDLESIECD